MYIDLLLGMLPMFPHFRLYILSWLKTQSKNVARWFGGPSSLCYVTMGFLCCLCRKYQMLEMRLADVLSNKATFYPYQPTG